MALKLDGSEGLRMQHIEVEVMKLLTPYRENTEAALVIFAILRIARSLLRLYSAQTQAQLLPVLVAFLEGKEPGTDAATNLITLQ
jgi:hypothetical protein